MLNNESSQNLLEAIKYVDISECMEKITQNNDGFV